MGTRWVAGSAQIISWTSWSRRRGPEAEFSGSDGALATPECCSQRAPISTLSKFALYSPRGRGGRRATYTARQETLANAERIDGAVPAKLHATSFLLEAGLELKLLGIETAGRLAIVCHGCP